MESAAQNVDMQMFIAMSDEEFCKLVPYLDEKMVYDIIKARSADAEKKRKASEDRRNDEGEPDAQRRRTTEKPRLGKLNDTFHVGLKPPTSSNADTFYVLGRTRGPVTDYPTFGFGSNGAEQVVARTGATQMKSEMLAAVERREKNDMFHKAVIFTMERFFSRGSATWGSQVASLRPADVAAGSGTRGTVAWLTADDLGKLDSHEAADAANIEKRKYVRDVVQVRVAYWQSGSLRSSQWAWHLFNKNSRKFEEASRKELTKNELEMLCDLSANPHGERWLSIPCFTYLVQKPYPVNCRTRLSNVSEAYIAANMRNVACLWSHEDVKEEFGELLRQITAKRTNEENEGCCSGEAPRAWTLTTDNFKDKAKYKKGHDKRAQIKIPEGK